MLTSHHTDFGLLAGAGGADQSFQLIPYPFIILQDLSQLLHKVLSFARVWEVSYTHTKKFKKNKPTTKNNAYFKASD